MPTFQVTDGVWGIDTEMFDAGVTAVYLFDDEAPTLVDAGTAASAETIVAGLRDCGVDPADLSTLVCSHIHVDHSGAASALVEQAPDLDVYIHELTASHLIDPSGLVASSRRAMGEHFAAMGEQGPVPEANVITVPEAGTTVELGANSLELIHAPGHSPDHLAAWNPERELLFAGECLGVYLERADSWLPPATLPNFDVDLVDAAIARLRELDPKQIVVPHFGELPHEPAAAFDTAERELHRFDEQIRDLHAETDSLAATKAAVADELIDIAPPYDPAVEEFYASLITDGYLKHHGIE